MKNILFTLFLSLIAVSSCRHIPIDPVDPDPGPIDSTAFINLAGTYWELIEFRDEKTSERNSTRTVETRIPQKGAEYTLYFSGPEMSATANCNMINGGYMAKKDGTFACNLGIIYQDSTCGQDDMPREYLSRLNHTNRYSYANGILTLHEHCIATADVPTSMMICPTMRFRRVQNSHPRFKPIVVMDMSFVDIRQDPCEILSTRQLEGNLLELTVQYSGGCENHEFHLFAHSGIMPGNATDFAKAYLTHDSHGDMCKALKTEKIIFDMTPLLNYWRSMPHRNPNLSVQFQPHGNGVHYQD